MVGAKEHAAVRRRLQARRRMARHIALSIARRFHRCSQRSTEATLPPAVAANPHAMLLAAFVDAKIASRLLRLRRQGWKRADAASVVIAHATRADAS